MTWCLVVLNLTLVIVLKVILGLAVWYGTLFRAVKGTKTQDLVGKDIYGLPYNTTTQDGANNTNGASTWSYQPGDEDGEIVITPEDLGITGFWSWATTCGSYELSVAAMYEEINNFQNDCQQNIL